MNWDLFFNYGFPAAIAFWIIIRGEKVLKEGMHVISENTLAVQNLRVFLETKL